jgi:hypothetical protein
MLGTYTTLFESPIGPWTTLGPLILVLAVSLCQEGFSDFKRHKSDDEVSRWGLAVVLQSRLVVVCLVHNRGTLEQAISCTV